MGREATDKMTFSLENGKGSDGKPIVLKHEVEVTAKDLSKWSKAHLLDLALAGFKQAARNMVGKELNDSFPAIAQQEASIAMARTMAESMGMDPDIFAASARKLMEAENLKNKRPAWAELFTKREISEAEMFPPEGEKK